MNRYINFFAGIITISLVMLCNCTAEGYLHEIAITGVSLNKTEITIETGNEEILVLNILPSNATDKTVTWSSSNTSVATVDADGKVTAVAEGTAVITAKAGDKSASCVVTVTQPVTGITLNKTATTLTVGGTEQITATVTPANATDPTVTWSSNNPSVVTVSSAGMIAAIAEGIATITAKAGERTAQCTVTVTPASVLPALTTNTVTTYTATTATLGGNITNAGTPAYTERGVVYATTENPTIVNNKTVVTGTGTGSFTANITGLAANTTYYVRAYATNTIGTAYGEQMSFNTSGALPTLTTNAVTAFTATTATLGGNISNTGTPAYTERGVVYATTQNPTTSNNKTAITGTGSGSFSTDVTGLTSNTTYYVRAYATNSAGTAYGAQVSFTTAGALPTLTTNAVTTFTATTATLGGNISNVGMPAYTERGVVYATSQNPTTVNNKTAVTGTGTGSFSANVTNLTANTTYYVRAYATNTAGTAYGTQVSFTTPSSASLPTLTTNAVSVFTATTATLGGNISNTGTPAYTERGVVYATSQNPSISNNKTVVTGTGTGNFSANVTNLTANTTYYVRAYATNTAGTAYGTQVSFTTSPPSTLPTLTTNDATNITATTATLGGYISNAGTPAYTERGVVYATTQNPTTANYKTVITGTGTGNFSSDVTGLTSNTTYYVRAYATNAAGTAYGNQVNFVIENNGNWTRKADFAGVSTVDAVGFSIGNKGYIGAAGNGVNMLNDFWEYDPASNRWTQRADFAGVARWMAVGFSIGNKGYIGTGTTSYLSYQQDFWEYDPVSNSWTQKANFAGGGREEAVGFSIGNKGYIGTGCSYSYIGGGDYSYYKDFWEYDPISNSWTKKADFAGGNRVGAVGLSIGNKGYIGAGGNDMTGNSGSQKDFWEYDPVSNNWTRKADFPGKGYGVNFSIDNKGYIGDASYGAQGFWEYDPGSNNWKQKADFPGDVRSGAVGFSIGNKGYMGSGFRSDFWEFTP